MKCSCAGGGATLAFGLALLLLPISAIGQRGTIWAVSISSSGEPASYGASSESVSGDGSAVVFSSFSTNMVPNDTAMFADVFVHDLRTRTTTLVSRNLFGRPGNGNSRSANISAGGRFVAFESLASDLVPNDVNGNQDIFVFDRATEQVELVSLSTSGEQGNGHSAVPSISADGRFVAFLSNSTNLVPSGSRGCFVRDRLLGTTELVSIMPDGSAAEHALGPTISADGRFVAMPAGGPNSYNAVVRDRVAGTSEFAAFEFDGQPASVTRVTLSGNGRYVAFTSLSNRILPQHGQLGIPYLYDRVTGTTRFVGEDRFGRPLRFYSSLTVLLSHDGRYATFTLHPSVTVHDTLTGEAVVIPEPTPGAVGSFPTSESAISADGRYVAFNGSRGFLPGFRYGGVFLYQFGPRPVAPLAVSVEQGRVVDGWERDARFQDTFAIAVEAARPTGVGEPRAELLFSATAPARPTAKFEVVYSAASSGESVLQELALWDYEASRWEVVDRRASHWDLRRQAVNVSGKPERFIEPRTLEMRARLRFFDWGTAMGTWSAFVDYVNWEVER